MAEVSILIDGTKVAAGKGMTILEAARDAGITIPTLCHVPGLSPTGGCRICVVEVEGSARLVGSCHTPVADGMVVHTRSPKVLAVRKTIVELMLAGHTGPCVSDERMGQCELNRLASELQAGPAAFQVRQSRAYPVEKESAYITRDLSKCVLCGRCVRVCAEIAGKNVFGTGYRGFHSKIVVDCDRVLASEACRECAICAEYCPTSALTIPGAAAKEKKGGGRERRAGCGVASDRPGRATLLAVLKKGQKELGHLSDEFIVETARSLDMPVGEVFGVATFYSFLSREPRGRHIIRVCGNIPCYLRGSDMILQGIRKEIGIGPGETTADGAFSLELTNCIGACDVAPAMLVNDDVHGGLTPEKLSSVLKSYT